MRAIRDGDPDAELVIAAQRGDRAALDALLAQYLPLLYNIVGRALNGHADVDDVVQETMLRAVRSIADVRDPAAFRSWLVAIAVRKIRDHVSGRPLQLAGDGAPEVADPGADFVDLTIMRLGLSGQRRETAEATRWLDGEDRELLALWWQEAAGLLDRGAVAAGLGLTAAHTAVRVGRMKERLTTARLVVRALHARAPCAGLAEVAAHWDYAPSPLWRKRIARHARDCPRCQAHLADLVPAEQLLHGLPLLALPAAVTRLLPGPASAGAPAGPGHSGPGHSGPGHSAPGHPGPGHSAPGHPGSGHPGRGHSGPRHSAPGRSAAHPHGAALHHLRALPKAIAALQPKIVVAAVAATAVVAGGAVAVAHAQSARPTPVVPVAAPARSVTTAPVPPSSPVPSRSPRPSRPAPPPSHPAAPPPAAPPSGGLLKGVGAWNFAGATAALAQSRASWYFTWSTSPGGIVSPPGVAFVPDIWGQASVTPAALAQARQAGRYLLTFNEPDSSSQANMTVAQALADWPQLEATGMLLGSPAVQDDAATPGSWLDQFMSGAKARGYRVDFIVVHWYAQGFDPAASVSELKAYLEAIYQRYHLPIWLTEFGMVKFGSPTTYPTDAQQSAFLTGAAAMMAGLSYVQRYAWFALPVTTGPTGDGNLGLFSAGPAVTAEGRAFESAAGR